MDSHFVTYQQAKDLKELGFDLLCLTSYTNLGDLCSIFNIDIDVLEDSLLMKDDNDEVYCKNSTNQDNYIAAPLQQQVIEWAREEHGLWTELTIDFYKNGVNINWHIWWYLPEEEQDTIYRDQNGLAEGTYVYGDNGEYNSYPKAYSAIISKIIFLIQVKNKTGRYQDHDPFNTLTIIN